jgi:hypothetical protein
MEGFSMRLASTLIAVAALVCMGASTAPAAALKVSTDKVRLNDTGNWRVEVRVIFLDGSWTLGFLQWTGVQSQINWATAVVTCLQGNGGGFQPEPRINLVGSRIEIVGQPTWANP